MDVTSLKNTLQEVMTDIPMSAVIRFLIIMLLLMLFCRVLLKIIRKVLQRTRLDQRTQNLINRVLSVVLYTLAGLILAAEVGLNTSALVALISVFSLGISLALNNILANVAGGVIIYTSTPFQIGDFVKVGELSGTVQEVRLNYTRLLTVDGLIVTVPNHEISDTTVTNYTGNHRRRLEIKMSAGYSEPVEKVKKALLEAAERYQDRLLPDPAEVWVTNYGDSNIDYTLYCWVKPEDFLQLKRKITEAIWENFCAAQITLDYSRTDIRLLRDEPQAAFVSEEKQQSGENPEKPV